MTFATMVRELTARMENLSDARAGVFINDAYWELCDGYSWPFLIPTAAAGAAPLTITTARKVLSVVDTDSDRALRGIARDVLLSQDPELAATGDPWGYHVAVGATSSLIITTYPSSTHALSVVYVDEPAVLTGTDTPVVPGRYHGLIVDLAQLRACRRHRENINLVPFLQSEVQRELGAMVQALMVPTTEPEVLTATGDPWGY